MHLHYVLFRPKKFTVSFLPEVIDTCSAQVNIFKITLLAVLSPFAFPPRQMMVTHYMTISYHHTWIEFNHDL